MTYCKRQILVWLSCSLQVFAFAQVEQPPPGKDSSNSLVNVITAYVKAQNDTSLVLIADITIHGNKRTKPFIIEREIPFKQGDYIRRSDLEKKLTLASQQIKNTALFTDAFVYIHSILGPLVFINIDVKERWYFFPLPYFKLIDRNFNQWWVEQKASLSRVNYGIKFQQGNVSGRNDKLAINLITGYSRQVQLKYEQPYAFNSLKSGYSLAFSYANQRELNYQTDLSKQAFYKQDKFVMENLHAELAYLYRPAIKTNHTFRVGYVRTEVSDTIIKLNPNYYPGGGTKISFPEFSYTIQYFNTDYRAYPSKGFMGDASITRKGWNKEMNLTQLEYHANYAIPVTAKTNLYLQSSGTLKFPFNQPFYNQQLFGYGDAFLRGLEYYVIDGYAGLMGRSTIRREFFSMVLKTPPNTKKEVMIPMKFFVKAGADMGYAYTKTAGNSLLSNRLLYTEMIGLDMVIPSYDIVFKFEYSFNQLGESGLFFHVRTDF